LSSQLTRSSDPAGADGPFYSRFTPFGMSPKMWATDHDQKEVIMKTQHSIASLALLIALCLVLAAPAIAGTTLYDNGPIKPNALGYTINSGYQVADSFTLSQASTVTGFTAGLEVSPGDLPKSVSYCISATPLGCDRARGTVTSDNGTLTNVCFSCGEDLYESTGSIVPVNLPAGTYYVTLKDGVTKQGNELYWTENDGTGCTGDNGTGGGCPSIAYDYLKDPIESEAFQILGTNGSDFSLTATPPGLKGTWGNFTVSVMALGGFNGTVALSCSTDINTYCSLNPVSIVGSGNSTLEVSTNAIGIHYITVTGRSGILQHNATVTLVAICHTKNCQ
jgi:hypothetical protein